MHKTPGALLTEAMFDDPQAGDHFSEMAAFHLFVVWRHENLIITCEANAPCTLPQDGTWRLYESLRAFQQAFSYDTVRCRYWVRFYARNENAVKWMKFAPSVLKQVVLDKGLNLLDETERAFIECEDTPFGWWPDEI